MVKFFTLPPDKIPYPYILVNANRPNVRYIWLNKDFIEMVIIDSGVEMFRNPSVKDYPPRWFDRIAELYKRIKKIWLSIKKQYKL